MFTEFTVYSMLSVDPNLVLWPHFYFRPPSFCNSKSLDNRQVVRLSYDGLYFRWGSRMVWKNSKFPSCTYFVMGVGNGEDKLQVSELYLL